MTIEQLQQVMAEIGPLTDEVLSVVQIGDREWDIALEDDVAILASYDELGEKVTFDVDVGPLPEGDPAPIFEMLLTFNSCWRETGGLRTAIDEPGGDVSLVLDYFAEQLDVTRVSAVILALLEKRSQWREAIEAVAASGDSDAAGQPLAEPPGSMRV
ncbi:MAG: CesT family type III secretion system chaperone [Planctomycetota bacterium]